MKNLLIAVLFWRYYSCRTAWSVLKTNVMHCTSTCAIWLRTALQLRSVSSNGGTAWTGLKRGHHGSGIFTTLLRRGYPQCHSERTWYEKKNALEGPSGITKIERPHMAMPRPERLRWRRLPGVGGGSEAQRSLITLVQF
jgi:hypothetical protein